MGRLVILLALLLGFQTTYSATINVPGDQPNIQAAVNAANPSGDIIVVAAGTYIEQVRISGKSVAIQGAGIGQSIIQAMPLVNRTTYSITQWEGSARTVDAMLGVTEATAVDISGFTFDGLELGPDNFYGVHFFNSDGSVTNCEFVDITNATGTGAQRVVSLAATHGVSGSCTVDFSNNEVPTFQKVGILLIGPSATGTINYNTIAGGGITTVAQNGIQVGYGAAVTLTGNDVSMVAYPGDDWAGTGITLFECGDVTVSGGSVIGSEIAIGHSQWNWIYTPTATPTIVVDGVTLDANQWAVSTHLGDDGASLDFEVLNCQITNCVHVGVNLHGSDVDPWGGGYYAGWTNGNLTANIHDNTIINGDIGCAESIELVTGNTVVCTMNHNDLTNNSTCGAYNNFTNIVDATANWWGDVSGPDFTAKSGGYSVPAIRIAQPFSATDQDVPEGSEASGTISPDKGTGSAVTVNVDYSPWWGGNYLGDPHASPWDWHVNTNNASTIQEGVDIATVGDDLFVEGGTYEEQVVIDKALSLIGVGKGTVTLQAPADLPEYFTTGGPNRPIIYVHDADVAISEMTIDGLLRGNDNYRFTGIGFWNCGGSVTNVDITGVRDDPFSGAQHGVSIYAFNNTGGPYTIDLTDIVIDDIQKAGIVLGGSGLTANLTRCSVTGAGPTDVTAQNGIQVGYGASGEITDCNVADVAYTAGQWGASGILFYEAANGAVASGSVVSGSQAAIVFHETSGSVNGATVTTSGTNNEEGISVRDYSPTKATGGSGLMCEASPFVEDWQKPEGTKAAVTIVTVTNATLYGIGTEGSYGMATWGLGGSAISTLLNSDISGWDVGVVAYDDGASPSVSASHNRIYDNTYGFWTNTSFGQLAERNYWGSDHGPTHAANPNGDGDEVGDWIDYEPWCNYDFSICDIMISCCLDRVGDANGVGGDEPTIGDISSMVEMLFLSGMMVACMSEADVNQSGGYNPVKENVTISDISILIDYLFITGSSLGLPNCL